MDQMQADAGRSTRLPPDVNPVSEVVNTAMRAATTLNRNLLDNFAAYQKEWIGFLNRRAGSWIVTIAARRGSADEPVFQLRRRLWLKP